MPPEQAPGCVSGRGQALYLELVPFPADAAREAWLLNQLLHLLQERRLRHDLALLVCLQGKPKWHGRRGFPPTLEPSLGILGNRAALPQTLE